MPLGERQLEAPAAAPPAGAACRDQAGNSLPKREIRPGLTEPVLTRNRLQTGRFGPISSICFEFKRGQEIPKRKRRQFLCTGMTWYVALGRCPEGLFGGGMRDGGH